jgi:hypothetical protein
MLEYLDKHFFHPLKVTEERNCLKCPVMNLFNDDQQDYLMNPEMFYIVGANKFPKFINFNLIHLDQVRYNKLNIGFYYNSIKREIISFAVNSNSIQILKTFPSGECEGPFSNSKNELIFIKENGEILTLDSLTLNFVEEAVPKLSGRISTACIDNKGNKWICTHDNGVFVYPKYSAKILSNKKGATCLTWNPDRKEIIAGFEDKSIQTSDGKTTRNFNIPDEITRQSRITNIIYKKGYLYLGCDNKLAKFNIDKGTYKRYDNSRSLFLITIKDMEKSINDGIIIGSANGACFFSTDSGVITEELWKIRTTAVCDIPEKGVFLGTVNGLNYRPEGQKDIKPYFTGSNLDKARVTDIKYDKRGRIWVGTAQYGLFIIDGTKLTNLNDQNPINFITSYFIKNIFIDKSDIAWIGTDKGINRISCLGLSDYKIDRITTSLSIPDDNTSALYVTGDTIYIASLDGISCFKYNSSILKEIPGMEITEIFMNGERLSQPITNVFNYSENNISIEYSAISFKNARNIEFNYRFAGSSNEWIRTSSKRIDLSGIKAGKYRFEIRAVNPITGEKSDIKHFDFVIKPPFYQNGYFILGSIVICLLLIWKIEKYRINTIRKKSEENNRIHKQFVELEMQALRAQMNPHFIFNAMSAIQSYFIMNKEEKANAYMARFARLIRQMLDYSRDNFISLDEEISLLANYMSLEKMRFETKLEFYLHLDSQINPSEYILPSLLLQPILENAVNHGIIPSKNNNIIQLNINLEQDYLICDIQDNGIGINQSKGKKIIPNRHQSTGMDMILKRIQSINDLYNCKVKIDIDDLSEKSLLESGTKIRIHFPIALVNKNFLRMS